MSGKNGLFGGNSDENRTTVKLDTDAAFYAERSADAGSAPARISRKGIYRHRLSADEIQSIWNGDRDRSRRFMLISCGAAIVILLLCVMTPYQAYNSDEKFIPVTQIKCWIMALRLLLMRITGGYNEYVAEGLIESVGGSVTYLGALAQLKIALMSFVAGAGVAMAGAIFQTAYKNPMASPNILGSTAGIQLGNAIMVMTYSSGAALQIALRYKYCYGLTAVCVLGVLILGRLASNKNDNYSVMEMVMIGSVMSQALNVVSMYLMYNMEDEDMVVYQELSLGTYLDTDPLNIAVLLIVMAIAVIPVLLMRYRLNIIGLDKTETTSIGLDPTRIRWIVQICGVLMSTAAMIHCGQVGMISMLMPYLVRKFIGSDFRYVCVYSGLYGGVLLVFCRMLASCFEVADEPLPVTVVMNLFLMPAFMVVLAKRRGDDL